MNSCIVELENGKVTNVIGSIRNLTSSIITLAESPVVGDTNVHGYVIHFERLTVSFEPEKTVVICSDVSEYVRIIDELSYVSLTDELTKIPTRRSVISFLEKSLIDVHKGVASLAVIYIDLDNFKKYNDLYGHPFGDEILKIAASRFKNCLRTKDFVARIGGDEFIVVVDLTNADNSNDVVRNVINRIFNSFSKPMWIDGKEANIFCSAGIYVADETDQITTDEIVRCADSAMLVAKGKGRSNYQFYDFDKKSKTSDSSLDLTGLVFITDGFYLRKHDGCTILKSSVYSKNKNGIAPTVKFPLLKDDVNLEFCNTNSVEGMLEKSDNFLFLELEEQINFFLAIADKLPPSFRFAISDEILNSKPEGLGKFIGLFPHYALLMSGRAPIGVTLNNLQLVNTVIVCYENCLAAFGEDIDQIVFSISQIAAVTQLKLIVDAENKNLDAHIDNSDYIFKKVL